MLLQSHLSHNARFIGDEAKGKTATMTSHQIDQILEAARAASKKLDARIAACNQHRRAGLLRLDGLQRTTFRLVA